MWTAAAVLACALDVLGRSAASFPPIALVDVRPAGVPADADAFVRRGERRIYLMTMRGSAVDQARRSGGLCGDLDALKRLASVLVHEEWHVMNGADERGAYDAQLMALRLMHAGPGHAIYQAVLRNKTAKVPSCEDGEGARACR